MSIADADATCAQLLAANPFVRDDVRLTFDATRVSTVPGLHTVRPARTHAPGVRDAGETPPAITRAMSLVLRI